MSIKPSCLRFSGYADKTVENYVSCIAMFTRYLKQQGMTLVKAKGTHICQWIVELKNLNLSYSRLEHHRSALRIFYAMLVKFKIVSVNPAKALPRLRKNGVSKVMPVSKDTVNQLLNIVDRSTWMGMRNYLILSMLWALGLRISS